MTRKPGPVGERVREILKRLRIEITEEQGEAMDELLADPPEPTEALKRAMARHWSETEADE